MLSCTGMHHTSCLLGLAALDVRYLHPRTPNTISNSSSCNKHSPALNSNMRRSLSAITLRLLSEHKYAHRCALPFFSTIYPQHILLSPYHFPHTILTSSPSPQNPNFLTRRMAASNRSGSAHFQGCLQAYQQTTGVTLAEHPVVVQLLNCNSLESITTLLLCEARAFNGFRGFDRMTKAIEGSVSILFTLSATASIGDAIDSVCQKILTEHPTVLIDFTAIPAHESNTGWPRCPTCGM
jgi:hypothetical protein